MRIVKEAFLRESVRRFPKARRYLENWRKIVRTAAWNSLQDVRTTYPSVDAVKVASGRQVLVFNVCGNDYRLIAAAHFNCRIIYTLRLLTHAEYDKNHWKQEL